MTDTISRQAVEDLIMETDPFWCEGMTRAIFEGVKRLPTIYAVPVVRCKDCKHNYSKKHNKRYNHEDIVCDYFETDGLNADDFCSYGERSEDNEAVLVMKGESDG